MKRSSLFVIQFCNNFHFFILKQISSHILKHVMDQHEGKKQSKFLKHFLKRDKENDLAIFDSINIP